MSAEVPMPGDAVDGAFRPSRAELRRRRESAAAPVPAVPATATSAGRAALREQRTPAQDGVLVNLLKAWWLYPLLALIALCLYLGWRSTQTPQVPPGVQVSTPAPQN